MELPVASISLCHGAVLQWRAFLEDSSEADKAWEPPQRLRMNLLESSHLSGEAKVWHRILAATSSKSEDRRRESRLDRQEW